MGAVFGSGAGESCVWKWGSWEQCLVVGLMEQCSVFGSGAHRSCVLCLVVGLKGALFVSGAHGSCVLCLVVGLMGAVVCVW